MVNIESPTHKAYLFQLFYDKSGERFIEKKFRLDVLMSAASCLQKLDAQPVPEGMRFEPGLTEFSIDEAKLIKDLLSGVQEATPSEYLILEELKAIFV